MAELTPDQICQQLPHDVAEALREGRMNLVQALLAEAFDLVDVFSIPGFRWAANFTPLGKQVRETMLARAANP